MKIISNTLLKAIPSGTPFKAYFQGADLRESEAKLLFNEPHTGSVEMEVNKTLAAHGNLAAYYPKTTEKKTFQYRAEDAMECVIKITYRVQFDGSPFVGIFPAVMMTGSLTSCQIESIDLKMSRHDKTITVCLAPNPKDVKRRRLWVSYYWGFPENITLNGIFMMKEVMDQCWHILDNNFTHLVGHEFKIMNIDNIKAVVKGIASSNATASLAEDLLEVYCEYVERDMAEPIIMSPTTLMTLVSELVQQGRAELLQKIPLELRTSLVQTFNKADAHEVVAALNYYHKGDYLDPTNDKRWEL